MKDKLPRAFLLFLAFFFFTEILIYYLGSSISANPNVVIIQDQVKISKIRDFNKEVLIFGDSSAALAIDPVKLERNLGMSCYNFSTVGPATMAVNYYLFENYLRYNTAPKFIILMNTYDAWGRDIDSEDIINTLAGNYFLGTAEALISNGDSNGFYKFLLYKIFFTVLPSERYKYEIRRLIKYRKIPPLLFSDFYQRLLKNNGSYRFIFERNIRENKAEVQKVRISEDLLTNEQFVKSSKFYISSLNRYFLNKFIMTARKNDIIIFVCFPPLVKEFYNFQNAGGYLDSYRLFLRRLAASSGNILFLTDDFYAVDKEQLAEAIDHLNDAGAGFFTEIIADRFRKRYRYQNGLHKAEKADLEREGFYAHRD